MDTLQVVRRWAAKVSDDNDRLALHQSDLLAAIRAAHRDGKSLREIGEAAGLSHEKVRQLLQGRS